MGVLGGPGMAGGGWEGCSCFIGLSIIEALSNLQPLIGFEFEGVPKKINYKEVQG